MREWGKVWTSCKHKCLLCYKNRYNKEYGILIRSYSSLFHHRGLVIRAMKRLCHGVIVRWRLNLVPIVPCYRIVAQSLSHNRTIVFWTFMHMRCLQENSVRCYFSLGTLTLIIGILDLSLFLEVYFPCALLLNFNYFEYFLFNINLKS